MSYGKRGCYESERGPALDCADLLATLPGESFDRLAGLTARLLGTPVAVISLLDGEWEFLLGHTGLPQPWANAHRLPLHASLARHVLDSGIPFAVADARMDLLTRANPLLAEWGVGSYLGIPLITSEGHALGCLSVIDHESRAWSEDDVLMASDVAESIRAELALRINAARNRRSEAWRAAQGRLLEEIARGEPLDHVIRALVRAVEGQLEGVACSVLRLEGTRLRCAAAPGLSLGYLRAIEDLEIGPSTGSCGTAAYTKQRIIVTDIATDPRWSDYREAALANGLRACWSAPVLARNGEVLGTFALYYGERCEPRPAELLLIETASHIAAIAFERERDDRALRESEVRYRTLADSSPDAIVVHRAGEILYVNRAAAQLVGANQPDEIVGRSVLDLIEPDYVDLAAARMSQAAAGEALQPAEYRIRRLDGKLIDIDTAGRAVPYDGQLAIQIVARDITERKQAERALEEATRKLSAVVEASPAAMYVLDRERRVLLWNPAAERIFGWTAEEVLGVPLPIVPDSERTSFEEMHRRALAALPAAAHEVQRVRKDGTVAQVNVSMAPLTCADEVSEILVVVVDITELMAAESALRESERRFGQLAENIPQLFWMTSADRQEIVYVSHAYETVWGRSRESLFEQPGQWLQAVHPEDRERVAAALPKRTEGTYDEEYRVIRPDGEVRWVRDRAFPISDDRGEVYRVAGIAEDVTEHRRRGEEILLLAAATDQSGEGVIITDAAGTIEYVNPAFEQITGYARSEVLGKNPRILNSGKQDADFYRRMWTTLRDGKPWHARFVNRRKDGTLYTQDSVITPVCSGDREITHFVAVLRDVTHEIALEQQVRESQKMEAVGRLAGGIAHDFNNVLTIVTGRTQLILDDLEVSYPSKEDLEEVLQAAGRAQKLTRQLLAFSRKQVIEPRVLELGEVIRAAEKLLRRLIGEDVELDVVLGADLGRVKADPTQIDQVLVNLAVNARDAMPEGGALTILAEDVDLGEGRTYGLVECPCPGPYVRIRVADTGTGMDEGTQERLFEPFFTTKPVGTGTGLGLSTVYGIVKQSGGYIRVDTELGAGTTFEIYLPRIESGADHARNELSEPGKLAGSEVVLVVEDQPGVRSVVRSALERAGYGVLEAENGEAALAIFGREGKGIDLVITDVVMPRMGGRILAERLRERRPGIPILFMSGYTADDFTHQSIREDGVHLLEKPFDARVLQKKVREVLDRGMSSG